MGCSRSGFLIQAGQRGVGHRYLAYWQLYETAAQLARRHACTTDFRRACTYKTQGELDTSASCYSLSQFSSSYPDRPVYQMTRSHATTASSCNRSSQTAKYSELCSRAILRPGLVRAMRKWITIRPCRSHIRDAIKPSQGSQVAPGHARPGKEDPERKTKFESLWNDDLSQILGALWKTEAGGEQDIADQIQECQEALDLPVTNLRLADVIQLILTSWRYGLEDTVPFQVQINRIKKLLVEKIAGAGGDGEARRNMLRELRAARTGSDSGRGANDDDESIQIHVEQDSVLERDVDSLSYTAPESSDASSMICSLYTVKSITSVNERTNWFLPPRNNGRSGVVP
ncbi:hypothetical protein BC827DRAFT_132741 [Russula dissimulans]|nr:hypothetical protein BC827DRAFT_132741 [Russula dissimulans]